MYFKEAFGLAATCVVFNNKLSSISNFFDSWELRYPLSGLSTMPKEQSLAWPQRAPLTLHLLRIWLVVSWWVHTISLMIHSYKESHIGRFATHMWLKVEISVNQHLSPGPLWAYGSGCYGEETSVSWGNSWKSTWWAQGASEALLEKTNDSWSEPGELEEPATATSKPQISVNSSFFFKQAKLKS